MLHFSKFTPGFPCHQTQMLLECSGYARVERHLDLRISAQTSLNSIAFASRATHPGAQAQVPVVSCNARRTLRAVSCCGFSQSRGPSNKITMKLDNIEGQIWPLENRYLLSKNIEQSLSNSKYIADTYHLTEKAGSQILENMASMYPVVSATVTSGVTQFHWASCSEVPGYRNININRYK